MTQHEKATFESILHVYVGKEFHQKCREKMEQARLLYKKNIHWEIQPSCMKCHHYTDFKKEPNMCETCDDEFSNFKMKEQTEWQPKTQED